MTYLLSGKSKIFIVNKIQHTHERDQAQTQQNSWHFERVLTIIAVLFIRIGPTSVSLNWLYLD